MRTKKRAILVFALFAMSTLLAAQNTPAGAWFILHVGTYTGPESKGIYAFRFDATSGKTTPLGLAAESANPSFLVVDREQRYLYAVNEIDNFKGEKSGAVSAFSIDHKTGKLTFLNQVSSHGAGPCHISLDRIGKFVLVANYDSGTIAAFPVLADGRLGDASTVIQHTGHGPNAARQEAPHAHEILVTPNNRFAIAADLGLDELLVYRFDAAKGTLAANDPPFGKVEPGAGPRHFAFHPNGEFVYALTEMGGSVTVFAYDASKGQLRPTQTISTLAANFKGKNESAEITFDASGKFLYASNRGPDDIAVFSVDSSTGNLTLVQHVSTKGKAPRNFVIDPTGKYLLAANQESNTIVVFQIDARTGRLTDTRQVIQVPTPVCITFVAAD